MNIKRKTLSLVLLVIMLISIPSVAFACFDEYGYNAQARMFVGTMDNWEAFLQGSPPTSFDPHGTDIVFVERKWNRLFDPMIQNNLPLGPGAWQKARLWEYLSGDQLGWTWHLNLEVVYSPNASIPGAIEIPAEAMGGFTGFYCTKQNEWLAGPNGEKTVIQDFSVRRGIIVRALFGQR